MKKLFKTGNLSAYEAITEAQKIAYAPLIFQAVRVMCEFGILDELEKSKEKGITALEIAENLSISVYGIETLLESGLSCGVVEMADDERFLLSKIGHYLLHDKMTRVNMEYNHQVCYQGMYFLDDAIKQGKPVGLKVFGEHWDTVYQALPHLPDAVKASWYAFDHFYSDSAYPAALPIVFKDHPKSLLDIGANIGKFSILAAQHDSEVEITMVDLPEQLQNAIANVDKHKFSQRINTLAMDLLDSSKQFPSGIDIYWLSQFLSCFGEQEIISILKRIVDVMDDDATVYILETCWDRQQHEAASFALVNTSLYFTAIASGNSKMYHSKALEKYISTAGLKLKKVHDNLGICHSLFECVK